MPLPIPFDEGASWSLFSYIAHNFGTHHNMPSFLFEGEVNSIPPKKTIVRDTGWQPFFFLNNLIMSSVMSYIAADIVQAAIPSPSFSLPSYPDHAHVTGISYVTGIVANTTAAVAKEQYLCG